MNFGLIEILITLAFIFSGIATLGSLIGIIIYAIKGKNKKPFLIGLAVNLIIFAATLTYILEHAPNKTPALPATQQTSSKLTNDKNQNKNHDHDKYDDDDYDDDYDDDDDDYDDDKHHKNQSQQNQNNNQTNKNQRNSVAGPNGETIKGNINSKGEKIYHMPGSKYYDKTIPEQWFFTEQDAQNAGYRPSKK